MSDMIQSVSGSGAEAAAGVEGFAANPAVTDASSAASIEHASDTFDSRVAALDREYSSSGQQPAEEDVEEQTLKTQTDDEPEVEEPVETEYGDLLSDGPQVYTMEVVNKLWNRTPTPMKEALVKASTEAAKVAQFGTPEELNFAATVTKAFRDPRATKAEADAVLQDISERYPVMGQAMTDSLVYHIHNDPDTFKVYSDVLLRQRFPDTTPEHIDELLQLERDKLIDPEGARKLYEDEPTAREKAQAAEIAQLKERLDGREGKDKEFEAERERTRQTALKQNNEYTDRYVSELAMKDVLPLAKQLGWIVPEGKENTVEGKALIQLADMLTVYINEKLKSHPEYSTVEVLKQAGHAWGEDGATHLLRSNAAPLSSVGLTLFKEAARKMQPFLKTKLYQPRQPATSTNKNGGGERVVPPVAQKAPVKETAFDVTVADLDSGYRQAISGIRASATNRRT